MDFLYDFKQAQVDRLEDAGVPVYEPHERWPFVRRIRSERKRHNPVLRLAHGLTTLISLPLR